MFGLEGGSSLDSSWSQLLPRRLTKTKYSVPVTAVAAKVSVIMVASAVKVNLDPLVVDEGCLLFFDEERM